jgi:hypothetical protein
MDAAVVEKTVTVIYALFAMAQAGSLVLSATGKDGLMIMTIRRR